MKLKVGIFLVIAAAAMTACYATVTVRAAAQESTSSTSPGAAKNNTWDGIYTKDQAAKGETLYGDQCSKCHGADGSGADAPTLVGGDFASDWDALTIGELFNRVRDTMPQDNPQSLSRDDTAALLAFIFAKNNFPASDTPLTSDGSALGKMKYLANKP
jgi:mono/diheme cytochrome c family protein